MRTVEILARLLVHVNILFTNPDFPQGNHLTIFILFFGRNADVSINRRFDTTDQGWYRIEPTDFNAERKAVEIAITLKFSDLSKAEQASFLECLTCETVGGKDMPCLYINWKCKYLLNFTPPRTSIRVTTGINGDGPSLSAEARELLRVTYLRPLRDSYSNMQAGRNSRLSQIIQGIPNIDDGITEYAAGVETDQLSISGIASLSNFLLENHPKLKKANEDIGTIMSSKMLLKGDAVVTAFGVAGTEASDSKRLISLLEKLDLSAHSNADELIEAIVAVRYESKNREQRIKDIQKKYEEFPDNESKSAYLYSFFSLKGTSKAEVAQHLSFILETKYASDPKALCERLPPYIRGAINYVTEQEDA